MNDTPSLAALGTALGVEQAAVFSYGVAAAFAAPERRALVEEGVARHRAHREEAAALLRAAGAPAPAAEPAYTLPLTVDGPEAAAELGAVIEQDCAAAWRAVVENADNPQLRAVAVAALTDTAVRLARWRAALGVEPATVPFPGAPTS